MVKNLPAMQETWVWFLDLKLAFFFLIKVMYAYCFKGQIVISFNKKQAWEFPGGPVVMTWCFHYWALGSIPGWVSKIPQAKQSGQGGGTRQILFSTTFFYYKLCLSEVTTICSFGYFFHCSHLFFFLTGHDPFSRKYFKVFI